MSQRGWPGSAQPSNSQARLPVEAAEALFWGKDTHNEHVFLYKRLREVEEQHRDYDARIQATETIAEAAEAATSRVRRIEQQVSAIESDEQDRPFDKWAEGEISGFKSFIEKNKNVRQKQIELEEKISHVEDAVDKAGGTSKEFNILLDRIARLEKDHISDANRIRSLEADVTSLTLLRQDWAPEDNRLPPRGTTYHRTPKSMMPPPSRQPRLPSVEVREDEETEDEDIVTPYQTEQAGQAQIQVPRSPDALATSSTFAPISSPSKGRDMSARLRMMQRKSIHDPKKSREPEPRQSRPAVPISKPRTVFESLPATQVVGLKTARGAADTLPATQVISRKTARPKEASSRFAVPGAFVQSEDSAPSSASRSFIQANEPSATQVIKRSGAGNPKEVKGPAPPVPYPERTPQLIVKIPTRKRKLDDDVSTPRQTRSQASKSRDSSHAEARAPATRDIVPTVETEATSEPVAKRRKANDTKGTIQALPLAPQPTIGSSTMAAPNAANLVKTSPRKAAVSSRRKRCNPCHARNGQCDYARPVCGHCKKQGNSENCVYANPPSEQSQMATSSSSSPKKRNVVSSSAFLKPKTPAEPVGRLGFHQDGNRSSSKTMSVGQASSPTKTPMPRQGSKAAASSRLSAVPRTRGPPPTNAGMPTLEYFKELEAKNLR